MRKLRIEQGKSRITRIEDFSYFAGGVPNHGPPADTGLS